MTQSTQDNIYFNIQSDTQNRSIFQFDANRVQPVLDNPSDYELSVVRFSIPSTSIPVMNWKNETYKIGIEFNGTLIEKYVDFVPNSDKPPLYENTIGQVWSYQEWCAIMSNCLTELHDQMVIAQPTFPATTPILWKIQPDTEIMSLYCPSGYADPNVKVYFNNLLEAQSIFQAFAEDDDTFRIYIKDKITNRTTYGGGGFIMSQEYPTTSLISNADKILVETNSIPVNPELLGSKTNEIRQVVTDFDIAGLVRDSLTIQFYPQGPLRYYQLKSSYPLYRMNVVVRWEDVDGITYPIYLQENAQLSMKIHFRKKGSDILFETLYKYDEMTK